MLLWLHSPSADSSPSQERPQAIAEADLPVITTREQKLLKWQNFRKVFSSAVVVCVASVTVTLVIMATLGIHGFIECTKQISELAVCVIMTNSDFTKVLTGCSEERSDLKQQLRNATLNLIAAINEMNDVRKIVEEYGKITVDLKEKLGLIQYLNITTHNYSSVLREAIRDLTEVYNSYSTAETEMKRLNIENLRLREVADNCTHQLGDTKQLKEENLKLQNINNSYATLYNEVYQLRIKNQNFQVLVSDYKKLNTEMEQLREVADNCSSQLNDTTKQLMEENLKLQSINNSYTTLFNEVNQLRTNNHNLQVIANKYTTLKTEIEQLKEVADNCTIKLNDTTKQLKKENLNLQNITNSYATLFNEVNQLRTDHQNLQVNPKNYTTVKTEMEQLSKENQALKKAADNYTNVVSEMGICAKSLQGLRAIVFNQKFSSIWDYCNNQTLKCAHCMPNWTEHSSRCAFFSTEEKPWANARADCVRMGGDLAIVSSEKDQRFLTNLVKNANIVKLRAAWIGLSDLITEDKFVWVNAEDVRDTYWRENEPNNHIALWDKEKKTGQDCVTIEAAGEWPNSWDDVICTGERHYICETMALPDFAIIPPT